MLFIGREYTHESAELAVRDDQVIGQPHRDTRDRAGAGHHAGRRPGDRVGRTCHQGRAGRLRNRRPEAGGVSAPVGAPDARRRSGRRRVALSAAGGPLVAYLDVMAPDPDAITIVVVPEYVVRHWWERVLHNRTAERLRHALLAGRTPSSRGCHTGRSSARHGDRAARQKANGRMRRRGPPGIDRPPERRRSAGPIAGATLRADGREQWAGPVRARRARTERGLDRPAGGRCGGAAGEAGAHQVIAVHVIEVDWMHDLADVVPGSQQRASEVLDRAEAQAERNGQR